MTTFKINNASLELDPASFTEISVEDVTADVLLQSSDYALLVSNEINVTNLDFDLSKFAVIILMFPHFKDGRAFSQARRLREQLGFTGEIRARGDIARDQVLFMVRSGFNSVELSPSAKVGAAEALEEFSLFYQAASDPVRPVWYLRSNASIAA